MKFFKHPLFILILFFLLSRLINLTLLPVFSDEALYMEWGWREITIPGQAFHSLYDAKQPFLMWFFGLGQIIFPDPLFGSRLTSVFTGLLSLLGLWLISKKLFDQKDYQGTLDKLEEANDIINNTETADSNVETIHSFVSSKLIL